MTLAVPIAALDGLTEEARLLDYLAAFVRRYVVLSDEQVTAVALWVMHTHAVDALGITPYLSITSAEKGSGKTILLETLELLVARPWLTGSITAATLARKIHAQKPTLLLDESDTAFRGDRDYAETLRGILNSGFKASGTYSRCVGSNGVNLRVEDFNTFCPKAIAGIGKLPDTVADRAIPIRLKRKGPGEHVERRRERKVGAEAAPLREQIEGWADKTLGALAELEVSPLVELGDRANDIWEPLLGIARLAGGPWFTRARRAAVVLSRPNAPDMDSTSVRLLADIHQIFNNQGADKLSSVALALALAEIEESPWGEWKAGRPLTPNGIAKILSRYEIRPRTIRLADNKTPKGYRREMFADAWGRYLPVPPSRAATPPQPAWLEEAELDTEPPTETGVAVSEERSNRFGYSDVADVADGAEPRENERQLTEAERIELARLKLFVNTTAVERRAMRRFDPGLRYALARCRP